MAAETKDAPAATAAGAAPDDTAGAEQQPTPEQVKRAEAAAVEQWTPHRPGLRAKIQYATALARSGLLPKAFRYNPANVLYAIEYGEAIGVPTMAAITGINVIDGKPTASAALISSLVRKAGHRLRVGYDEQKWMGWAEITRSDDPDFTFRVEWNLDRALTAELCTLRDGKPYAVDKEGRSKPWRKFYPAMVKWRAITECARDACEEALNGMHYTPDELGAEVDEDGRIIDSYDDADPHGVAAATPPPAPPAPAAAAQAEPPAEDGVVDAEFTEDTEDTERVDPAHAIWEFACQVLAEAVKAPDLDTWREAWNRAKDAGALDVGVPHEGQVGPLRLWMQARGAQLLAKSKATPQEAAE